MTIVTETFRPPARRPLPAAGMAAAALDGVVAAGQPARLRADRAVRAADLPVRGRQLLGLRPHRHLPGLHLDELPRLLTTPATIRVYVSSLTFAVIVWAITLFLGFNIAHFLIFHVRSAAVRTVLFLLCAIPFWTSGIIRTIAWIPFLGRNGAFNQI